MLTHKDRLTPALVDAKIHTAARGCDLRVSRFGIVIDDHGHECGAVSDRYKLVRNADLAAAIDLASDKIGIDLECELGRYRKGTARFRFLMPETWRVPGDTSDLRSRFEFFNGYGGSSPIKGWGGTYRLICTNGMFVGKQIAAMNRRHVGDFNLFEIVESLMLRTLDEMQNEKERAVIQAETPFEYEADKASNEEDHAIRSRNYAALMATGKDTPKKFQRVLVQSIHTNRENLGHTVWAVTQAIAEVARHDRKDTPTAHGWARRNQVRILETVGI